MASTLFVKDILSRVSTLLQDSSPQYARWSENELATWFNDGQRAIAKFLPSSSSRLDVIKLSPGTRQQISSITAANIINGDGSLSTATRGAQLMYLTRNMGSTGSTPGSIIRPVDRHSLDMVSVGWHMATPTTSIDEYMFDPKLPRNFYVSPPVHPTTAVWVEIAYLSLPNDIPVPAINSAPVYSASGTSTLVVSIDDLYVDDLVNYITARAFMKDAEFTPNAQYAQTYTKLFMDSINAQSASTGGQQMTELPR